MRQFFRALAHAISNAVRQTFKIVYEAGRWTWALVTAPFNMDAPSIMPEPPMPVMDEPDPVEKVKERMVPPAEALLLYARRGPASLAARNMDPGLRAWVQGLDPMVLQRIAKRGLTEAEKVLAQGAIAHQNRPEPVESVKERLKRKYAPQPSLGLPGLAL